MIEVDLPPWLGWAAAAGAAIMVPFAYVLGQASMQVEAPAPVPPPLPGDPYLRAQVALLGLPPVREAARRLISAVPPHAELVADVISASRGSREAHPGLPAAYREAWEAAEADAERAHARITTLSSTLSRALAEPEAFVAQAPPEVAGLWRALFPATATSADGAALAAQLLADVLREALFAPLALAQLVGEAVPREVAGASSAADAARMGAIAEAFGWRYEHVALYGRSDADFLLDDATVTGVPGEDVLSGLPAPAEARAGVIVRVRAPVLRPPSGQAGLGRAHLLSWRAP